MIVKYFHWLRIFKLYIFDQKICLKQFHSYNVVIHCATLLGNNFGQERKHLFIIKYYKINLILLFMLIGNMSL